MSAVSEYFCVSFFPRSITRYRVSNPHPNADHFRDTTTAWSAFGVTLPRQGVVTDRCVAAEKRVTLLTDLLSSFKWLCSKGLCNQYVAPPLTRCANRVAVPVFPCLLACAL